MKDIYLEIKGADIEGETQDKDWVSKKAVEVVSFAHLIRQPKSATASSAGGHTAERTDHGEIILTKDIDRASVKLLQACSAGTIYKDVILHFYRAVGGSNKTDGANSRTKYLMVDLKNVLISSVSTAIGAEGMPVETIGLKYAAIKWTYQQSKIDGTPAVGPIFGAWNLATNQPVFG